jgi:hypothetical protein
MMYQLHARNFTSSVKALAQGFRYIPGNKYIILFSSGIASSVLQGAPVNVDRQKLNSTRLDKKGATLYNIDSLDAAIWEERKFEDMVKELAQANCPVFILNTEESGQGASYNRAMSGEYTLKKISKISGGEYFPQVQNYKSVLAAIQDRTSSYYVLGYYIEENWDGRYHEVKVKVRRKDCQVQAQGGYFNPKPFEGYTELEKNLHLVDLALSENPKYPVAAEIPLTPFPCPGEEENVFLVVAEIDREQLPWRLLEGGPDELVTVVFDSQHNIVDFKRMEVNFSAIPQKRICYYTFSLLPPGEYRCSVVLRNMKNGTSAVGRSSARIVEPRGVNLMLFRPLFLARDADTFYVSMLKSDEHAPSGSPPSLARLYPFDHEVFSPVGAELMTAVSEIYAVVVFSLAGIDEPDLELLSTLRNASTGEEVLLPHSVLSVEQNSQGEDKLRLLNLFLEFKLRDIKPGDYILKIVLREGSTASSTEFSQNFKFK